MARSILTIPAWDKDQGAWRVIVETPKGSGAKYDYNAELGAFELAHILPEGSVFPYAFGFIPSTVGDDGDPLDVLLLIEESTFCGSIVLSRVIGVIEGEQTDDGKRIRNDRFLAVPIASRQYAGLDSAKKLPKQQVDDLCNFFEDYNRALGRKFKVLRWAGPDAARKLIERSARKQKRRRTHG